MASTQFETIFENMVFSFISTNCNVSQVFHWEDKNAMLPFHHDLFKVNITVVDTDTNYNYRKRFYVTAPDWVSRKEQREYIYQVIISQVKFCNHLNADSRDDDGFKQMRDSIRDITEKTADYMIDWYKQNYERKENKQNYEDEEKKLR